MDLGQDHGWGAGAPALSVLKDGLDPRKMRLAAAATCVSLLHLPPPCMHRPRAITTPTHLEPSVESRDSGLSRFIMY